MDILGKRKGASASGEGGGGRGGGGAASASSKMVATAAKSVKGSIEPRDLQKMMLVIMKLCLSSALACRVLKSVVLRVILISAKSIFVVKGFEATKAYSEAGKDYPNADERIADIGLPSICLFNSWIQEARIIMAAEKDDKECQSHTATIDKFVSDIQGMDADFYVHEMAKQVTYCRINKAHGSDFKKLEFRFIEGSQAENVFNTVIKPIMVDKDKAVEKKGVAPPGDLERQVQTFIDEIEGK